jgi:hypothetical protein
VRTVAVRPFWLLPTSPLFLLAIKPLFARVDPANSRRFATATAELISLPNGTRRRSRREEPKVAVVAFVTQWFLLREQFFTKIAGLISQAIPHSQKIARGR